MAFGAFKGGGQGGGDLSSGIKINQGGLSDMFANLSSGLFAIGKSMGDDDTEKEKMKHQDAQSAAQHAFEMNLARFNRDAMAQQAESTQKHADHREDVRAGVEDKHWQQTFAHQQASDAENVRYHNAEIGTRNAEVGLRKSEIESRNEERKVEAEKFHQQVEASKAAATRGDAKDAAAIAEKSLEPYKAQVSQAQAAFNAIAKSNDPDSDAYKSAQQDLADASAAYESQNKKFGPVVDKVLKAIGYPAPQSSQEQMQGVKAGGDAMPDDRKAVIDAYVKQGASPAQAAAHVNALPQSAIDKALGKPPQADAAPPSQDFMPPSDASQPAPQMASTLPTAPPPDAAAPPTAAPDAAPQLASAAGPPDQQSDPNAQYQEMAQKLQQSPDGQGTLTTLDRLASAPAGPIADKMRRAAQNSLTEQFPDADPDAFIDSYLQQQQQEPEQTETA